MKVGLSIMGISIGILLGIGARIIELVLGLKPNNAFAIAMVPILVYYLVIIVRYKNDADVLREQRNKVVLTSIAWLIATYVFLINTTIF